MAVVPPISARPETLDNGYTVDLGNLPKVHFAEHPEWEELFDASWKSLTTTIKKAGANLNSKEVYYIDKARAFSNTVFAWDTMFTLMYAKYAQNEFPILPSLDTFYEHQIDSDGEDDGYIPREIDQDSGKDRWRYDDVRSMNPPLWAWAEWDLYQTHGDVKQFSRMVKGKTVYERMVKHYNFIERYKKLDNGLYGKTNGYGNGLDNTFNQGAPYAGNLPESSGGQTYNDLSLQQAQFAYYLSLIAKEMGKNEDAAFFAAEHARISARISALMWDDDAKMFSNLDADGNHTNQSTPTTLWALAAHVATPEQAAALVKYHGQNSQKLFRPYGLATCAYDNIGYVPGGDYWRGSFWGPTSYQYIKGLEEYGYDEVALEESLRHMTSVLGVWKAGVASGNETETNPLWENYSSEYLKRGSTSNPDYGWIGCVSVGVMIEDILGLKPHAAQNTVNWSIRLTEEHGIDDLRYIHDGVENVVSFRADKRVSAALPVSFSVIAKEPFTLIVDNGAVTKTFDIEAGVNLCAIDGGQGKAPCLDMDVESFDAAQTALTPERFSAAKDFVLFGTETDTAIYDGLQRQIGKKAGFIKNVNTIGYSPLQTNNPPVYRANGELRALGFAGTQDVVKNQNGSGNEGFMFTVPADNEIRTLTAIVGVRNGTAEFTANLSDESAAAQTATLTGGSQESTYQIEIPYRASSDNYHVLIKYTITSSSGSVSLKGILLEDGGRAVPDNVTLTPSDGTITVDAQCMTGAAADAWNIYAGTRPDQLDQVIHTDVLPYTLNGLTNGRAYYIALESVTDGVSSLRSQPVLEIPEEDTLSWGERVGLDLEAALPVILGGNTGDIAEHHFQPVTEGAAYKSIITFNSDTNGKEAGVDNSGMVIRPAGKPITTTVTITASHGKAQAVRTLTFTVPPVDMADDRYVVRSDALIYPGRVYLSREGETDWMQIAQPIDGKNGQSKKQNGSGIGVPVFRGLTGDALIQSGASNLTYVADDAGTIVPVNNRAFEMRGAGNAVEVPLASSDAVQRIAVYYTVSKAAVQVDLLIDGQVMAGDITPESGRNGYRMVFAIRSDSPAVLRLTLAESDSSDSWAALNAVTLWETDSPFHTLAKENKDMSATDDTVNQTVSSSGTVNLTLYGGLDWMQFASETETAYARKLNGTGLADVRKFGDTQASHDHENVKDGPLTYISTDSDPAAIATKDHYGLLRRGIGNGVEFTIRPEGGKRLLQVYTGNYAAQSRLEYIVNGKTVYTYDTKNQNMAAYCTNILVDLQPHDTAVFRLTHVDPTYNTMGCSILFAATLGIFDGIDQGTTIWAQDIAARVPGGAPRLEESYNDSKSMGYISKGMWLSYNIDVETAGVYDIVVEYSTANEQTATAGLQFDLDGSAVGYIKALSGSGAWQQWSTATVSVDLPAGAHTLRLDYTLSGPNLRSLCFLYRGELSPVDKTALRDLVEQADTLRDTAHIGTEIGEYSLEAYQALSVAVHAAHTAIADEHVIQSYVDDKVKALKKAMDAFGDGVILFNKDALNALIAQAEGMDTAACPPDKVQAWQMALVAAEYIARNDRVTQEQVEAARMALQEAYSQLIVYQKGDVNNNGTITAADALMVLQASTKKITLDKRQTMAADVDGSGEADAADALLILQYATKKIRMFPEPGR